MNATLVASLKLVKRLEDDIPLIETSGEATSPEGETYSLFDRMRDETDLFEVVSRREQEERLRWAVAHLDTRERLVILAAWGLFGCPRLSCETIARALRTGKLRVLQIEKEARQRLEEMLGVGKRCGDE